MEKNDCGEEKRIDTLILGEKELIILFATFGIYTHRDYLLCKLQQTI
jgi:hypothetical protein